jgi:hypothetical protein
MNIAAFFQNKIIAEGILNLALLIKGEKHETKIE